MEGTAIQAIQLQVRGVPLMIWGGKSLVLPITPPGMTAPVLPTAAQMVGVIGDESYTHTEWLCKLPPDQPLRRAQTPSFHFRQVLDL